MNRLYGLYRPFPYRWKGAPAGGPVRNGCQVPVTATRRAETAIDTEEQRSGKTVQVLQLSGRLALLQGRFDDAIATYRRGLQASPSDPETEMELAIAYAMRAKCENWPVDYESAMEHMLTAEGHSTGPEISFDNAALLAEVGLPHASVQRWRLVVEVEQSPAWREEAYSRLAEVEGSLATWNRRLHQISDSPSSYLAHTNEANDSIEVVLIAALQHWLPNYRDPTTKAALTQLSMMLRQAQDPWLSDLLQIPITPTAASGMEFLAAASKANNEGEHIRAAKCALRAERFFRQVGNVAGALRARIELVYSLDRRWRQNHCLAAVRGVREEADRRHYGWIAAQAWLEKISCSTQTRKSDVIADGEAAYKSIASTPYTGLQLRALSFLTEQYFSFDRRLRIWSYGLQGLRSFWDHPLPPNRGYTFYYTIGSSARTAGNSRAALELLREGVGVMKDSTYRQLYALALSDLGEWEFEQGLSTEAKRTFEKMDKVFGQLDIRETASFRRLTEIARARLDINAGEPNRGLARLSSTLSNMKFPYANLSPTERRSLLPVLGDAFLRSGDMREATRCYRRAILENAISLNTIHDPSQRENAQQEIEPAWKGQTEIYVRKGQSSRALEVWESFRAAHSSTQPTNLVAPPEVSVVVYAFLPTGLSGWVKDQNGVEQKWLPENGIRDSIKEYSLLVADPNSPPAEIDAASRNLYRLLIRPFESRLINTKFLVIDAEGPLAGIPWPALKDDQGLILLEKFSVTQAVGWAEAMNHFEERKFNQKHGLILSDPAIGERLRARFPSLTDAEAEADWLERRVPDPAVFRKQTATVANLMEHLPQAAFLHFAGHGVSYGGFGALLLAVSSPSDGDTKYVTAGEIAKLHLARLQLVVLAACSSGVGENEGAVNLDSLVRGFLAAGAWRVVATRWNVRSQSTSDIIIQFYRLILKGERPAEALRQAILAVRRNDAKLPPYYWAGFQIFGTP